MRKYKCRICKNLIEDTNELYIEIHMTKSGNKVTKRFHKICFDIQQRKIKEKDDFYDYIKKYYFKVAIPKRFFMLMSEIACSYKDILDCCFSINLYGIVSSKIFTNDISKSAYIVEVIKGNINRYIEQKNSQKDEGSYIEINDFIDDGETRRGQRSKMMLYEDFSGG